MPRLRPDVTSAHRTIVVASDGLWKYVNHERIAETAALVRMPTSQHDPKIMLAVAVRIAEAAALRPLEAVLDALVAGVRLRSGGLQDDVAIVVCEVYAYPVLDCE